MGSWSVGCQISNIAITSGQKCVLLPIKKNLSETREWTPATLPIFAEYNDYGGVENIEEDDNTKLIEEHFGVTIDEFCEFLVDGEFTYDREEAQAIYEKMQNKEEVKNLRFMWIDRQVFDFMTTNQEKYYRGRLNYGTPEMLKLFGFELVEKSDTFKNYDPKRFNQLWKKGKTEFFSDGRTLLATKGKGNFVYDFGKGNESSIETYFDVPEEFHYLKNLAKHEAWRLLGKSRTKSELGYIFGDRYDFDLSEELLDEIEKTNPDKEVLDRIRNRQKKASKIYKKYFKNIDAFGDRIAQLINVSMNLYPMSGRFYPHILYLTPQCGEYKKHQALLDKFAEINKSLMTNRGYDEDEE